jgi:hypothetical protein
MILSEIGNQQYKNKKKDINGPRRGYLPVKIIQYGFLLRIDHQGQIINKYTLS